VQSLAQLPPLPQQWQGAVGAEGWLAVNGVASALSGAEAPGVCRAVGDSGEPSILSVRSGDRAC